jgi:hypothetical protein
MSTFVCVEEALVSMGETSHGLAPDGAKLAMLSRNFKAQAQV